MEDKIENIFKLASLIGNLKKEKRFKTVEGFDGDTVAAHSWRLAVLVFLVAEELELDVDIFRAVKLALIHDFPESITGDIDAHLSFNNKSLRDEKDRNEQEAFRVIGAIFKQKNDKESLEKLWKEYSTQETPEARYVYVMDKIEGVYTFIEPESDDYYDDLDLVAGYCSRGYQLFPELKPVLDYVQKTIKKKYKEGGYEWKEEYDNHKNF